MLGMEVKPEMFFLGHGYKFGFKPATKIKYALTFSNRCFMDVIKIIIHFLAVIGLIITLGDYLNWYKDSDRISFLQIINTEHKCTPNHPGAQKFLKSFLYKKPMADEERNKTIGSIIFTGIFEKGRGQQTILTGLIKVKTLDGYVSRELCSFDELHAWAKESPFWKWTGWWILAISVVLKIIIDLI